MDKHETRRVRVAIFATLGALLVVIACWFGFSLFFTIPRLSAGKPQPTSARWQIPLDTTTRGGVDVYGYRVRLTRMPMPERLREAQIPETGAFRLNGQALKLDEWVDFTLDPPLHVDQRTGADFPVDLRHTLFDGPAIVDLEFSFGGANRPKTLMLADQRINVRTDF